MIMQQTTSNFVGQSLQLVKDYTYSRAYSYSGPAEYCRFSFSLLPDQIPGADWINQQLINVFASKMASGGREMLELKLWEDKVPFWHTDYICDVIYTDPGASTTALAHVGVIIATVLATLFIIAVTFLVHEVNKFWYGGNGTNGFGSTIMAIIPIFLLIMMMGMMMPMMASSEKPKEEIEQGG